MERTICLVTVATGVLKLIKSEFTWLVLALAAAGGFFSEYSDPEMPESRKVATAALVLWFVFSVCYIAAQYVDITRVNTPGGAEFFGVHAQTLYLIFLVGLIILISIVANSTEQDWKQWLPLSAIGGMVVMRVFSMILWPRPSSQGYMMMRAGEGGAYALEDGILGQHQQRQASPQTTGVAFAGSAGPALNHGHDPDTVAGPSEARITAAQAQQGAECDIGHYSIGDDSDVGDP